MFSSLQTVTTPDGEFVEVADTLSAIQLRDWIVAAAIFIISVVLATVVRRFSRKARAEAEPSSAVLMAGRIGSYGIVLFGAIYSLGYLGVAITPLLGAFGVIGIAFAFALQDILENFVAGIILQVRRPFKVGDEIESDSFVGVIKEIDARTVTLRTPEGELVRLPSAEVIKSAIVNQTAISMRRTIIDVSVAYSTDLDVAVKVLADAALVDGVNPTPAPRAYVQSFDDSGISIAVHFWHASRVADQWKARDEVARSIHRTLAAQGIEMPFPQRVLHYPDSQKG